MVLLILFAFVAGAATAVSPCVLPVLPVALGAGVTGGRRRPLGVVTGLALSFTFATVALVYVISAFGLPDGLLRTLAVVALAGFGVCLLVPPIGDRLEARLSRLGPAGGVGAGAKGDGFWSGMLVGGGLGFVYAPCAGPILAGVITVSASQSFTAGRLTVALAYGIGSAVVLYALMLGGRRVTGRLARRSGRFQMAMGAVMVLIALLMLGNYDTRFETSIASGLPSFLVDPTSGLESSHSITTQLAALRGRKARQAAGLKQADAGLTLPVIGAAPEFKETQDWFNTPGGQPLTLAGLRGHVVLVDFWTYTCINCIRTLPYLNAWYAKYHSQGFEIVGVHTPEFPFEHSAANVAAAIEQNGIHYPVVQDNDYGTWNAYENQYWPAEYLIDAQGRIRLADFGEGEYPAKERAIRSLLVEAGENSLGSAAHVHAVQPSEVEITPESYLGSERAQRFTNGQIVNGLHEYGPLPAHGPPLSGLRYAGLWRVAGWGVTAERSSKLALTFRSRRAYLVMGSPGATRPLRVLLDGHPVPARLAGSDVHNGTVAVSRDRLYRLVELPNVQTHTLTVEAAPGVEVFDYTFG
ncbi:MAG TPA: cytochrome c biogenesis protein DipZ [Solirubrobacteraceae bacterium]|jgi:cytochrome c biogenesis protein CcdA/thiol-disulfide isomerase/thioredoxin|nr:cytochrome c biogenesis protein DipZ [Solirubrobacteraceae bacterium]